jgi:hypothetical protein
MKRREFLKSSAAIGFAAAIPNASGWLGRISGPGKGKETATENPVRPLKPPATGQIPIAFLLTEGAVLIDFAGRGGFQDVMVPSRGASTDAFRPTRWAPTRGHPLPGGLQIVPDYALAEPRAEGDRDPAQKGSPQAETGSARRRSSDVTAVVSHRRHPRHRPLAGKMTSPPSYRTLAMQFPDVHVRRGVRFVDEGSVASAGGLSSGMDLALHVVERYFGRDVATETAYQMEYQGQGWLNPASNAVYLQARKSTDGHSFCPVCDMEWTRPAPRALRGKCGFLLLRRAQGEIRLVPREVAGALAAEPPLIGGADAAVEVRRQGREGSPLQFRIPFQRKR